MPAKRKTNKCDRKKKKSVVISWKLIRAFGCDYDEVNTIN